MALHIIKLLTSSVASLPLHRHVTAKLSSPPFTPFTLLNLKLSFLSTSIAADTNGTLNSSNPLAENTPIQQQNPVTQFLLKECGMSQSQLLMIIKRRAPLLNTSTETAEQVVQLFRDSGFTEEQVRRIIIKNPRVVCINADQRLKPTIELMKKTLGLTGKDLGDVLCAASRLLNCSLDKTLIPKIQYLQSLLTSKADLATALKSASWFLECSIERVAQPNVDLLQQSGIQGELFSFLIARYPCILSRNTDSLKIKIEYVRNMGISQASKGFVYALIVVHKLQPEVLKMKLKHLASFGLLEYEIEELIRKYPLILTKSIDKMQKTMDFFIKTAGLPANIIVKNPTLIFYSLETRIKPRYAIFKFRSEMQLYKSIPSLAVIIQLREQRFIEKYIKASPYATRLMDIYHGKSIDLDIIQTSFLQD